MKNIGAIFDWDGVVVNSGRLHVASWTQLATEENFPPPNVPGLGGLGLKNEKVITELLRWTQDAGEIRRLMHRKETIFRERVASGGIEAIPGVIDFLRQLQAAGIPAAIGSSAPRANVKACIAALKLHGLFAGAITAEDVSHGKPDPEVFLKCAALLGRAPAECVVFEDAPAGVAAALAGGIRVIGVLTMRTREDLAGAERYIRSFAELTPADLSTEHTE
ncbi:MAG: HAD family phosphatase [Verrucomicrobia bacterium]|nr:MAG: HAD family phosphatase [Verrucomicrobiota bacterium]